MRLLKPDAWRGGLAADNEHSVWLVGCSALLDDEDRRRLPCYSVTVTPEPPISFGRSFIFGNPSVIRSTVS